MRELTREHYTILAHKIDIITEKDNNNNISTYCTLALNTCTTKLAKDTQGRIFQTDDQFFF